MTRKLLFLLLVVTRLFIFIFFNILFSHASDVESYDSSYAFLGKRQKKVTFLVSLSFLNFLFQVMHIDVSSWCSV